jgi:hypothetical protein
VKPPNTVIERGLGGPICGECQRVLPVAGALNRVCIQCHPQLEFVELLGDALGAENSRELDALAEIMKRKDMTARGVIRHLFRLGHMIEQQLLLEPDTTIGYLDDQGDFHGFFDRLPKKAPMPDCGGVDCKILQPGMTYHNTDTCPEKELFVKERINPDPGDIRHGL